MHESARPETPKNRSREAYYDWRANEYDDFWLQRRRYSDAPSSWFDERDAVFATIASLPPKRTLDVACGTGFITQHLPGDVTGLDHSSRMLAIARSRLPTATLVRGDGMALPFDAGSFERVFASHFYGHLNEDERVRFLSEARRVASELIILDAARHQGPPRDVWEERELNDGTQWLVFKRFFSSGVLLGEIGGGDVLFEGDWFICIRSSTGDA